MEVLGTLPDGNSPGLDWYNQKALPSSLVLVIQIHNNSSGLGGLAH